MEPGPMEPVVKQVPLQYSQRPLVSPLQHSAQGKQVHTCTIAAVALAASRIVGSRRFRHIFRKAKGSNGSKGAGGSTDALRNPFTEWRDSGYALPGLDGKNKEYSGDDWLFGMREALGGKEKQLQVEAQTLAQKVADAERRQAQLSERLDGAEEREGELRKKLEEEQERARMAQKSYEELEKQIEDMKKSQLKMERELAESKAREADRAQELNEKETELITVRREKVVLTKELADAKKREQELTMLLEEAQQQILELTSVAEGKEGAEHAVKCLTALLRASQPLEPIAITVQDAVVAEGPPPTAEELFESSLQWLPLPSDQRRPRRYSQMIPYVHTDAAGSPLYPEEPSRSSEVFERYHPDTLFFIFYFQQGTYQQYLAAKELKKLGWRYHTKYLKWFQRHEHPRLIAPDYERGDFLLFDETEWMPRVKQDFTFEYAWLESP